MIHFCTQDKRNNSIALAYIREYHRAYFHGDYVTHIDQAVVEVLSSLFNDHVCSIKQFRR